ncbi:winged helix-turn-helix domain-containing protein [Streptomyces sp. ASQP_92]|uniref:BTAD domain-containing putative transcriptional regulator n=1 Tax=Streptomyces sp. ASQP_92 TaxID=2979116 RepID=UPI0021BF92A9|nr:BTAD domain-containing putative transcriptional regulator [Streptomyces sp. ASQP_92]MCT9090715.1 winged helix-turn-helix domain-containing protein [Streptomyces sp. ASQP_92]
MLRTSGIPLIPRRSLPPVISVKLLGRFEVHDSRGKLVDIRGDVARRVLAHLLLAAPHVTPNHRLIEAVWEGDEPESAIDQIRKTVSRLRRELPGGSDLIRTEPGGYRIFLPSEQIDLGLWREAIQRSSLLIQEGKRREALETLTQGLDLWRGRALAGMAGRPFTGEAVALHEERSSALETWCRLGLEHLDTRAVVARLRREIRLDPVQEKVWGILIRTLAASGRRLEAIEEYNRLRKVLAGTPQPTPSKALRDFYRDLKETVSGRPGTPSPESDPGRPAPSRGSVHRRVPPWIQELLRGHEPLPAYVLDAHWNVLHRNQAMERWFPWLRAEGSNLLSWALFAPSARTVLHAWDEHAMVYLGIVRNALRERPEDPFFRAINAATHKDPTLREMLARDDVIDVSSRSGHHFTLNLPQITPEPINVISHALRPEGNRGVRVVVLTSPHMPSEETSG